MKEWNTAYPIKSRDDKIRRPCGHTVSIPYEAFGDPAAVPCSGEGEIDSMASPENPLVECESKCVLEVLDTQGIYYVKWYVEGDARADNLKAAITSLIEVHGLSAVYYEVRSRDGFCGNCGTPLIPGGEPHHYNGFGSCWTENQGSRASTEPPRRWKTVVLECDKCHQRDEYSPNLEWQECTNCRILLSTADRQIESKGGENNG